MQKRDGNLYHETEFPSIPRRDLTADSGRLTATLGVPAWLRLYAGALASHLRCCCSAGTGTSILRHLLTLLRLADGQAFTKDQLWPPHVSMRDGKYRPIWR